MLDVVVSGNALIAFSPLLALVAIAIKLESKGPVFFLQTRNGCNCKPFKIIKFRTMNVMENGSGAARQATRNDPRVTRVGRILRKTSLDELPQLFNILKGDMSLVGPRPHPVALDKIYMHLIDDYVVRQHVKPGLTGWAQVNGFRGETSSAELMNRRVACDLWYAANASVLLDIEILARTFFEVLRQRNAY
jgi:exopolysaccharide biosynthesis polyprenyl glycosylphosphotransferase